MEYEEGSEEEEEELEKEDPTPTKEELEYLELRQRLKEAAWQWLENESASTVGRSQEKKKMPYDKLVDPLFHYLMPISLWVVLNGEIVFLNALFEVDARFWSSFHYLIIILAFSETSMQKTVSF